jgi:hypothetical protein
MDQQATIENLRWSSQVYLWLAIGIPILGAIVGGLLNIKRQHIEGKVRELSAQLTEQALREVEAHQRPRTLTAEQRHTLIQRLREGPKGTVHVHIPQNDSEGQQFADELARVLRTTGWTIGPLHQYGSFLGGEIPVGLQLSASRPSRTSPAEMPPSGEVLLEALRDVGIKVSLGIPHVAPSEVVHLVVGAKPQPRYNIVPPGAE